VTGAGGAALTVASAAFLGIDARTVVLTVDGAFGLGTSSVTVSGLQDLAGNTITGTLTQNFRSFDPPTAPVVCEVYQDIGGGAAIQLLMVTNLFTNAQPTWIVYSNLFGYNVGLAATTVPTYPNTSTTAYDQYGVKVYTYFVPSTTGNYKFWIRSDDGMVLMMNTNGTAVPLKNAVRGIGSPFNAQEAAQFAFDRIPTTKYGSSATNSLGLTISPAVGPTVVTGIRFRAANDSPGRDPFTYTLQGSMVGVNGPWTTIVSGASSGMQTDPGRFNYAPAQSFANAAAYSHYRLVINSVRDMAPDQRRAGRSSPRWSCWMPPARRSSIPIG
jgi:hypothetical protein